MGSSYKFYNAGTKDRVSIGAFNTPFWAATSAFYAAVPLYIYFTQKRNVVWLAAPIIPLVAITAYFYNNQPQTVLENGLNYILAKRHATVELERKASDFNSQEFTKSAEFVQLKHHLESSG